MRKQQPSRRHRCHWPGCNSMVSEMWACQRHWLKLPAYLREEIWRAYQPGQMNLSRAYVNAVIAARDWIIEHERMTDHA